MIDPRVLAREDPAQASLGRNSLVAVKGPHGAGQAVRGDPDVIAVAEKGGQHNGSSRADGAVGAWIRGIGGSDGERRPGWVADGCRIPVGVGQADGRNRSP